MNNDLNYKKDFMKLDALRLGIAGGILWGVSMLVMTLLAVHTDYARSWMLLMESVYPGYHVTDAGSIVGFLYGFIDGFVGLFLLAWLYNKLGCCCKCDETQCNIKK